MHALGQKRHNWKQNQGMSAKLVPRKRKFNPCVPNKSWEFAAKFVRAVWGQRKKEQRLVEEQEELPLSAAQQGWELEQALSEGQNGPVAVGDSQLYLCTAACGHQSTAGLPGLNQEWNNTIKFVAWVIVIQSLILLGENFRGNHLPCFKIRYWNSSLGGRPTWMQTSDLTSCSMLC